MATKTNYDDKAWEKSETLFAEWMRGNFEEPILYGIGNLICKHRPGVAKVLCNPQSGSYNMCFQMEFEDGGSAIMRIASYASSMFPDEKLRKEVAAMRYVERHTRIPVPRILHFGMTDECPFKLGPFIIMEYIEHAKNMTAPMNIPHFAPEDRPALDPRIPQDRLEHIYRQMAGVYLKMAQPSFEKVGSLSEVKEDSWDVTERALTFDFNDLVCLGGLPRSALPDRTFDSATAYYEHLADMHLLHLTLQPHDFIDSEEDCRKKFVARYLFRKLAREGRLTGANDSEPFRLFCDDMRPSNVLIDDENNIVAVIDWEFTYTAPAGFAYGPPWWLLIEQAENWPLGLDHWEEIFGSRLETFLEQMELEEKHTLENGMLKEPIHLAEKMRRNWETGEFWTNYAARKSWAFDAIYWEYIDSKFFGGREALEERIALLSEDERNEMENSINIKLADEARIKSEESENNEVNGKQVIQDGS